MFVILFVGTTMLVSASEKSKKKGESASCQVVNTSLCEIIKSDFEKPGNYFYENDINRFKSDVSVVFYITSQNEVKILRAKSDDGSAIKYIKQLFLKTKINVPDEYENRKFRIVLKLDYRAL